MTMELVSCRLISGLMSKTKVKTLDYKVLKSDKETLSKFDDKISTKILPKESVTRMIL